MNQKSYILTRPGQEPERLHLDFETNTHVFLTSEIVLVENTPRDEFVYSTPENEQSEDDDATVVFPSPEIPVRHRRLRSPPHPTPNNPDEIEPEIPDLFQPIANDHNPLIASDDEISSPETVTSPPPTPLRLRGPATRNIRGRPNPNGIWLTKKRKRSSRKTDKNGNIEHTEEEVEEAVYLGTHDCNVCYCYVDGIENIRLCSQCTWKMCIPCNTRHFRRNNAVCTQCRR